MKTWQCELPCLLLFLLYVVLRFRKWIVPWRPLLRVSNGVSEQGKGQRCLGSPRLVSGDIYIYIYIYTERVYSRARLAYSTLLPARSDRSESSTSPPIGPSFFLSIHPSIHPSIYRKEKAARSKVQSSNSKSASSSSLSTSAQSTHMSNSEPILLANAHTFTLSKALQPLWAEKDAVAREERWSMTNQEFLLGRFS